MDEQTLSAIVEWEFQEDMRCAKERAVFLGLLERYIDGTLTITDDGENQFLAWLHSQSTPCTSPRTQAHRAKNVLSQEKVVFETVIPVGP